MGTFSGRGRTLNRPLFISLRGYSSDPPPPPSLLLPPPESLSLLPLRRCQKLYTGIAIVCEAAVTLPCVLPCQPLKYKNPPLCCIFVGMLVSTLRGGVADRIVDLFFKRGRGQKLSRECTVLQWCCGSICFYCCFFSLRPLHECRPPVCV